MYCHLPLCATRCGLRVRRSEESDSGSDQPNERPAVLLQAAPAAQAATLHAMAVPRMSFAAWLKKRRKPPKRFPFPQGRHAQGTCAPCVFHATRGCARGRRCRYCHHDHSPVWVQDRPRSSTREMIKKRLPLLLQSENLDQAEAEANAMACRHHFARQVLENLLALQTSPNLDGHPN
ncbi:unnamed protein product [Durusdinium trenchii]|uniref:C3H1-type domain-containing protein n=1 Tax=Durusdinium trenchii TaxID=1381693 RepID=A0ABP0HYG2_9DINO